jgi:hypothetical protein
VARRPAPAVQHAALGAVLGGAVGDALGSAYRGGLPQPVIGGRGELGAAWGEATTSVTSLAERLLRGAAPDFDTTPVQAAVLAVFDRGSGTPPLLADGDAVVVYDAVSALLRSRPREVGPARDPVVAEALKCVGDDFAATIASAIDLGGDTSRRAAIAGTVAGATLGASAIPSRWITYVHGSNGERELRLRDLLRLTERLLRADRPAPPDPFRALWPTEVADGFWVSNLPGARRFADLQPDGAVVSLCPAGGLFDGYDVRREFVLADTPTRTANPRLSEVVEDLLCTLRAFRAEGRPTLVHCHHGASRTGLALRLWLMETEGLPEWRATAEAEARWPHVSLWNERFTEELQRRGCSDS